MRVSRASSGGPGGHRERSEQAVPPDSIGPVAQLGERLVCIQEVVGSIPVGSTRLDDRE